MEANWGVGIPWQHSKGRPYWYEHAKEKLSPYWWYDWKFGQMGDPTYIPMLFDEKQWSVATSSVVEDQMWFLFNEPERGDQANIPPVRAAELANAFDVPVEVGLPGILIDDVGLTWLSEYLNAKGPIPAYWTIHIYASTGREWRDKWAIWKQFMLGRGVVTPTIITETACTRDSHTDRKAVMSEVQRALLSDWYLAGAAWFSAHYGSHKGGWQRTDLLDEDGNLTDVGYEWLETRASVNPAFSPRKVHLPNISR